MSSLTSCVQGGKMPTFPEKEQFSDYDYLLFKVSQDVLLYFTTCLFLFVCLFVCLYVLTVTPNPLNGSL